jgi:hypothetical protein
MSRHWILVAAVVCALALLYFALIHQSTAEPGSGLGADQLCRRLLQEKSHAEAFAWIEQSKTKDIRSVGEESPEESLKIVKGLYASGAVQVQAVEVDRVEGVGETVNTLCVELPQDPQKRKKLLAVEAKVARAGGFDRVPDEGQQYMFLHGFKLTLLP